MYNTLFETPYNDRIVERIRALQDIKEHYNPTEPYHIAYSTYPSVNGSGRSRVLMCGGARGDPRSLGLDYDPRYLRSGSTINYPVIHYNEMMANPVAGGAIRSNGFHYQDDFNPYYNRVVSANMGTARPSFDRNAQYEQGGSKVGNFFKRVGRALAPVGRAVMPVVKEVGTDLLKDAIKGAIVGAGAKRRGRPRKVVGVGRFEGSGHPSGSPVPNDLYMGTGRESEAESVYDRMVQLAPHITGSKEEKIKSLKRLIKKYSAKEVESALGLVKMRKSGGSLKSFFGKVGRALKTVGKAVAPVAIPVLKEVGKDLLKGAIMGAVVGAGAKKRGRPRKISGGQGASVGSAGILSVTPNPPPELQVVGASGGKSNIGRKIKNTFKKVGKFLSPAVPVLKEIGKEVFNEVKPILIEEGKKQLKEGVKGAISGSGTKKGQVRKTARKAYEGLKKPNARAEIVKKIMAEKGMKMIEASKYVKEHGLYKK
jgi:hypothetical protein